MANRTVTLEDSGLLETATNWAADTKPSDGDTIVLNAALNAPDGYADGETLTAPLLTATPVTGFSLSLAGGADLALSDILGDLANQKVVDVTLAGTSTYDHDATETITGNVSVNDSTMRMTGNAAISGTVALANISNFHNNSTGTITGAVTADSTSLYEAQASHTITGGITLNGEGMEVFAGVVLTSNVTIAGIAASDIMIRESAGIVGGFTHTGDVTIEMKSGAYLTGTFDAADRTTTWINNGTNTLTVNATSDLVLGGAAVGLDVNINAPAGTVTAGDAALRVKSLTLTAGTYVAAATTHTVATNQVLNVAGTSTLTLTDAGLHVRVAAGTCTLGGDLSCDTLRIESEATLDGDSNDMTLATGRITGYGTLKNLVPAGIIHVAYGVIDGGNNSANVIFDPQQKMVIV